LLCLSSKFGFVREIQGSFICIDSKPPREREREREREKPISFLSERRETLSFSTRKENGFILARKIWCFSLLKRLYFTGIVCVEWSSYCRCKASAVTIFYISFSIPQHENRHKIVSNIHQIDPQHIIINNILFFIYIRFIIMVLFYLININIKVLFCSLQFLHCILQLFFICPKIKYTIKMVNVDSFYSSIWFYSYNNVSCCVFIHYLRWYKLILTSVMGGNIYRIQ
jgi:hypothetical protein